MGLYFVKRRVAELFVTSVAVYCYKCSLSICYGRLAFVLRESSLNVALVGAKN